MKHFLPSITHNAIGSNQSLIVALLALFVIIPSTLEAQNCSVNAGITQTVCADEPIFLQGNATGVYPDGGSSATWSQVGGPMVTIVSPTFLNTEITNVVPGNTYTFRLSDRCGDGTLVFQDVEVIVQDVTQADAGDDFDPACPGDGVITMVANAPDTGDGESGQWTVVSGSGVTFDDNTSPTTSIDFAENACGEVT
ncbi:MAG: hypothetical protein R6U62_10655, partial [Bacteroidales bacterium]